jgi:hypothetical protein
MPESDDDSTRPSVPAHWLPEHGWIVESTQAGGMRMGTSAAARGCKIGCLCGLLLPLGLFSAFMYYILGRFWDGIPKDGIALVFLTSMSLLTVGTVGLAVAAIVLEIMWLLLVREEWEVGVNRLEVRRRLLGLSWGRQFRDSELILDAKYGQESKGPSWQLAVKNKGRKHYLMRQGRTFNPPREEVQAVADLIAQTTGWAVTLAEHDVAEAVRSAAERHELPAELRAAGFRAELDERLRLKIRPPARGQLLCGIVLVVVGGGWTAFVADMAKPLVRDAPQQTLVDLPFLFIPALMLMAGVALAALGVVIIFGRERWILERNLLVVRSRLFGWKSEQQFVDGTLDLAHVSRTTEDGTAWSWELQLQNQAGCKLKVLRSDPDDDVPRQLGAVLSHHTGWPLRERDG